MKKNLPLLLLFAVVGLVFSCLSDPDERRVRGFSVSDARDFFEENADELLPTELIMPGAATRAGLLPQVVMTPLWKSASAYGADTVSVVDVPVMLSSLMLVRRGDNLPGRPETEYNLSAESRLVVTKKEGGSVEMFVTTMLPDYEYLLGRSRQTRYLHDANDFSGLIIFSHLDGSPIRISEYRGGTRLRNWRIVTADQIATEGHEHYISLQYKPSVTAGRRAQTRYFINKDGDYQSDPMEPVRPPKRDTDESWQSTFSPYYPPQPPTFVVPEEDEEVEVNWGAVNQQQTTPATPGQTTDSKTPKDALEKLKKNLKDSKIKKAMQNSNASFVVDDLQATLKIKLTKKIDQFGREHTAMRCLEQISYNASYFDGLNEQGKQLAIFHEYAHGTLFLDVLPHYDSNIPNYDQWQQGIRDIFPGQSQQFYDDMKWAGCVHSKEFLELPKEEQKRISDFVNKAISKQR